MSWHQTRTGVAGRLQIYYSNSRLYRGQTRVSIDKDHWLGLLNFVEAAVSGPACRFCLATKPYPHLWKEIDPDRIQHYDNCAYAALDGMVE